MAEAAFFDTVLSHSPVSPLPVLLRPGYFQVTLPRCGSSRPAPSAPTPTGSGSPVARVRIGCQDCRRLPRFAGREGHKSLGLALEARRSPHCRSGWPPLPASIGTRGLAWRHDHARAAIQPQPSRRLAGPANWQQPYPWACARFLGSRTRGQRALVSCCPGEGAPNVARAAFKECTFPIYSSERRRLTAPSARAGGAGAGRTRGHVCSAHDIGQQQVIGLPSPPIRRIRGEGCGGMPPP
jgi:hypothetical protein